MITLFTGVPGAGKTAAMVQLISELGKERALYVANLNGLVLPHFEVDPLEWHSTVPDGAIIVIDEVQEFWRPRSSGSKVPDCIAALEKHRHRGIDVYITTQHPGLLDANVRALVGRHVHIRDVGLLGRFWYEWPEAANVQQYKNAPTQKRYRLPKAAFDLYKSASLHMKPVRLIPRSIIYLGVLVLLMAAGGFYAYRSVAGKIDAAQVHPPAPGASQARPFGVGGGAWASGPITGASIVASFKPRIASRADSASAYDALRVVVVMPRIVGGYCVGKRCKCSTQQNTDSGLSNDECRAWLKSPPFDPYYVQAAPVDAKPSVLRPAVDPAPPPAPLPQAPGVDVLASR